MIDEEALVQENIRNLTPDDIPIVSYFGSGSSLLGSILIKLGMDYIEGYQERIKINQQETEVVNPYWREHWSILNKKYAKENMLSNNFIRFFKAHHYPESFKKSAIRKAVYLVRDGRDAILSYYNWRVGFANETSTLSDYLNKKGFFNKQPFDDWASFCEEWCKWGGKNPLHIIRYEDLKFYPYSSITNLLNFVGIKCSEKSIQDAIESTSFEKMRTEEEKITLGKSESRIFRKGLVGEWRGHPIMKNIDIVSPKAKKWLKKMNYATSPSIVRNNDICIIAENSISPVIKKIKEQFPNQRTKFICKKFTTLDLDFSLAPITISSMSSNEINRSIDNVCSTQNFSHYKLQKITAKEVIDILNNKILFSS